MKKYIVLFVALFISNFTYAQFKSLRELLLNSDVVAIIDNNYPDPWQQNKRVPISDYKSLLLMDSVKIISYLKQGKYDTKKQKLVIETSLNNTYYSDIRIPERVNPITPFNKPPTEVTLLFGKENKDYTEVLYDVRVNENDLPKVKEFMLWMDTIKREKNEAVKCRKYLDKYLATLGGGVNANLTFFEKILVPSSNFMQYYKVKAPNATVLTAEQKNRFKEFWEDEHYFDDIADAKVMYDYFPKETIEFFKNRFAKVSTYDDDFKDQTYTYGIFIEFLLTKENKLNDDNQFLINVLREYNDNITDLKRNAFEQLIKKIPVE